MPEFQATDEQARYSRIEKTRKSFRKHMENKQVILFNLSKPKALLIILFERSSSDAFNGVCASTRHAKFGAGLAFYLPCDHVADAPCGGFAGECTSAVPQRINF
jgi:hypothetical protein